MLRAGFPVGAALALLVTGCSSEATKTLGASATSEPVATATATATATSTPAGRAGVGVAANELGVVPVLMYHQVVDHPRRIYDSTPDQLRADLELLYREDYRPVTAADYVTGRIDLPPGMHPVVLTFDDSTTSQAQIAPDGEPVADTALGILEAFGAEYPDFNPTATFYVNTQPPPFVDDDVLPWLVSHGYEVGAHTTDHADLSRASDEEVQRQVGENIQDIEAAVPGYRVMTMATPYGVSPRRPELTYQGEYAGVAYNLAGVVIVNPVPAPSPYAADFNPYRIPRIGREDADPVFALLREHPERRFTSDGRPGPPAGT